MWAPVPAASPSRSRMNCRTPKFVATDISAAALEVARRNAARHGVADRVRFVRNRFARVQSRMNRTARFDLIVSNPPYVARNEARQLAARSARTRAGTQRYLAARPASKSIARLDRASGLAAPAAAEFWCSSSATIPRITCARSARRPAGVGEREHHERSRRHPARHRRRTILNRIARRHFARTALVPLLVV